jgi:CubicO group peptidase (beta-lactamase class C family)
MFQNLSTLARIGRIATFLSLVLTMLRVTMYAQSAEAAKGATSFSTMSADQMSTFFGDLIPRQLAERHIPGAVVVVVQDGEILFEGGYGYANLEEQIKVDPQTSLFRIASVTKLFTWTSVMQLVEQGKLDLDADVNQYLDFQIPNTFPQPITMKDLMSHTAGFEDSWYATYAAQPTDMEPLGQWLAAHIPERVFPPGQVPAYSNYGANLAGYIVERLSGVAWDTYVEQNILKPLGMAQTTVNQPPAEALQPDMATGYLYTRGEFIPQGFELLSPPAAGGMSAAGNDMARFMIAHLQNGHYGETQILQEQTARLMHSTLYKPDPRLNGIFYGFWEMSQNGVPIYGHTGDMSTFRSLLALFPEQTMGLFVGYNSGADLLPLQEETLASFVDAFFPPVNVPVTGPTNALNDAQRVAGTYGRTRASFSTIAKVMQLLSTAQFAALPDGTLTLQFAGEQRRYVEVAPLLFQQIDGDNLLLFRENSQGQVEFGFTSEYPTFAFRRIALYETPTLHKAVLSAGVLLLISALLASFGRRLRRKKTPNEVIVAGASSRWSRLATFSLTAGMIFVLLFAVFFAAGFANPAAYNQGNATMFVLALLCSTLFALATAVIAVSAIQLWRAKVWSLAARIHYTLVAIGAVALVWVFATWNLIGWHV